MKDGKRINTRTPEEQLILNEYLRVALTATRRILEYDGLLLEVFTRLVIDEEQFIQVYRDLRTRFGKTFTKKKLTLLKEQATQRVRFFLPKKIEVLLKEEHFKKKYGHLPQ